MTKTQEKIYRYILAYREKHGIVPSSRFLSSKFKMTPQGMNLHYKTLMRLKLLKKVEKIAHYEVVDNSKIK